MGRGVILDKWEQRVSSRAELFLPVKMILAYSSPIKFLLFDFFFWGKLLVTGLQESGSSAA